MKYLPSCALLLIFVTPGIVTTKPKTHLPFIRDDSNKAVAQARQRSLPLFVEVWAPW